MGNEALNQFLNKKNKYTEECLELIDEMMSQREKYGFAEQTLLDIYDFIQDNGYATEKQLQALKNIQESIYGRH